MPISQLKFGTDSKIENFLCARQNFYNASMSLSFVCECACVCASVRLSVLDLIKS